MGRTPLLAACALLLALALGPATVHAQGLPDFERVTLVEGLDQPTGFAYAPDGRLFVAEKEGRVRVVSADGILRPDPIVDIVDHVAGIGDRGLLGIAVDSAYPTHPYLYLLYSREHDPGDPNGPKRSVLTRMTVGPDDVVGPEEVILGADGVDAPCAGGSDCIPAEALAHVVGTVRSAPDGTLFVGNGDALWPGTAIGKPEAVETYSPDSYRGKILHVTREGAPVPGHPFCPGVDDDSICAKVHAMGFRNPFRFAVRPDGAVSVGDVGLTRWEEINTVTAGKNYGWPCYEGEDQTGGYRDTADCLAAYSSLTFTPPSLAYVNGGAIEGVGAAVVGGPFYAGGAYPDEYDGHILFADTIRGWLKSVMLDGTGRPVARRTLLPTDYLSYPSDVQIGPSSVGGDLVVAELGAGRISRIRYAPTDRTPLAVAQATPRYGATVDAIDFSSVGSGDPLGDPVTYLWDFGDGTTSTAADPPPHAYARGAYFARLTVTDEGGRSATTQISVFPGFDPPEAAITQPVGLPAFGAGDRIELAGNATSDAATAGGDRVALTGNSLVWEAVLHHADHIHYYGRFRGETAGFTTAIGHDADSWYEVSLTARDARGLSTTIETAELRPQTAPVELSSEPPGAPVSYDAKDGTAPWRYTSARGFLAPFGVGASFVRDGRVWEFDRWSNGGAQVQSVRIPADGLFLTAHYRDAGPASAEVVAEPPPPGIVDPPLTPLSGPPPDRSGPGVRLSAAGARRLHGVATDPAGIASVRVALRGRAGARCRFWSPSGRRLSARRSCASPLWASARLTGPPTAATRPWTLTLSPRLPAGRYAVLVRAADVGGNVTERWPDGSRTAALTVKRARRR